MTTKVAVIGKIVAREGSSAHVIEIVDGLFEQFSGESGTEHYLLHRDEHDVHVIWVYELYTDRDAVVAHGRNDRNARRPP